MPRLITSAEQFEQLKSKASECRVVRSDKAVKLKLRTPKFLYTYLTNQDEAEDLIKGLKDVEVIEFGATKKEDKEGPKKKEKSEQSS
ncbi:MAG: hypothetical protein PXY39_02495 [archaeon]|nr:hypothetical protein [archaeon]